VIAPATGGFLAHRFGFAMIFVVSAAVAIVTFALSLWLPPDSGGTLDDDDDDVSLREALRVFADRRLAPIYAVIVINMFLVGILFGFLPVYLHGLGYPTLQSGTIVSVATAAYLLIQPLAGWLADRSDIRGTILIGLAVGAGAITIITFVSGVYLIALVIAAGAGVGTVWTNSDALVGASAEARRLGASIGAAQSFKEFGDMVGPLLVGALTQMFGIRTGFVTCGTMALVLLIPLVRSTTFRTARAS
jgi:MFS family permease